jgi:hypothetical protein
MHRLFLLSLVLSLRATPSSAQEARPKCPASELHRYDFLVGNWRGKEYTFAHGPSDSVFEATWIARNQKLPFDCAFDERWTIIEHGKVFNQTGVMRAYDLTSGQWYYSLTDDFVEFAIFGSIATDSGWVYSHDLPGAKPVRLRTKWYATPTGYTELMQVSTDSGRTWPLYRHINYTRQSKH